MAAIIEAFSDSSCNETTSKASRNGRVVRDVRDGAQSARSREHSHLLGSSLAKPFRDGLRVVLEALFNLTLEEVQ